VGQLKQELGDALARLNRGIRSNEHVRILKKDGGWISLSPLPAQAEPANLAALKIRMLERWPTTSLLNVFKEADLRTGLYSEARRPGRILIANSSKSDCCWCFMALAQTPVSSA
jgi:hypothetical protein